MHLSFFLSFGLKVVIYDLFFIVDDKDDGKGDDEKCMRSECGEYR